METLVKMRKKKLKVEPTKWRDCGVGFGDIPTVDFGPTVDFWCSILRTSVRARGFATVKAYHRQWLRLIIDNCLSTLWDIKSFKPVIKWRIIRLLSPSKNIYVHFLKNPRKNHTFYCNSQESRYLFTYEIIIPIF